MLERGQLAQNMYKSQWERNPTRYIKLWKGITSIKGIYRK